MKPEAIPPLPAVGPGTSTIKQEFVLARQVLMSVMPQGFETDAFAFDLRYRPMIGIGGDHAGVERLGDGCFFTVSDVTGHGIAAALMVRDICGFLRGQATDSPAPGKLVAALNAHVLKVFSDAGIFMTFFCGRVDLKGMELVVCGAGHPPLLVCGPGRPEPVRLFSKLPLLGAGKVASRGGEERIKLLAGDRIVFYTDGVIEARGSSGEQYGVDRLAALCSGHAGRPLTAHLDAVTAAVDAFRGEGPQRDDVLVAAVDVRDPAASTRHMRKLKG